MKTNPGLRPRPEARVYQAIKSVALGTAIGVLFAGIYTFMELSNQEDCSNGIDDDQDGWVDMADSDCSCVTSGSTASFTLVGDAQFFGMSGCDEVYRLTTPGSNKTGLIVLNDEMDLTDTVDLTFSLDLGNQDRGGMGIYLVMTPSGISTSLIQVVGASPEINIAPSLILEIDTHDDGTPQDIAQDHLALYVDGDFSKPVVGPVALTTDVEDNKDHFLRFFWDPGVGQLQIFFDDMLTPSMTLRSNIVTDIFKGTSNGKLGAIGFNAQSVTANRQGVQTMNLTYTTAPSVSFPVEWLSFNVLQSREDALLTWATASEQNSNFFEIERSLDRETYAPVGRVDAAGNASTISRYHFKDTSLPAQPNQRFYYRLRQVDLDGTQSFSEIKELTVSADDDPISISAYPNPATTQATIQIRGEGDAILKVLTTNGTVVLEESLKLNGVLEKEIQVAEWPQGLYIIHLSSPAGNRSSGIWVR